MAVLIKGMNGLPKSCSVCPCYSDGYCYGLQYNPNDDYYREVSYKEYGKKRRDDCPLVLVEDDRVPCVDETLDKVMEEMCEYCRYPGDYKDQDELIEQQCNHCKVVEKLQEVLYGRKE